MEKTKEKIMNFWKKIKEIPIDPYDDPKLSCQIKPTIWDNHVSRTKEERKLTKCDNIWLVSWFMVGILLLVRVYI